MESIKLDRIKVNNNRVEYFFTPSSKLQKYFKSNNHMFIEYDTCIDDIPKSILAIPFISLMLPIIWSTDSILWIEEVDRTFYDSIFNIKNAYQEMYPHFKLKGTVVPAKTIYNTYNIEREAIQLFSGGMDANCTFIRIKDKNPILVNIYGWFEDYISKNNVFEKDKEDISLFAKANNVESNFVASNFSTFISNNFDKEFKRKIGRTLWFGFQHAMAFISIAIPLAYKYKVKNIYIASSNTLGYRTACASDPTTDIQFRYSNVGGTIHDGFELNRQDKTKIIVDYQKLIKNTYPLRVCSFNDRNCCECEKCFRTILGLVAEGSDLEDFDLYIEKDLKSHFKDIMDKKIHLLGLEKESEIYWDDIKYRMNENIDNIKEKEFVDWFLNYDFLGERKKAILKYRVKNFGPILKRKIIGSK